MGAGVADAAEALSLAVATDAEVDLSGVTSANSAPTGLSALAPAVAAGGGEGVPVYSIFSQHPAHDTANSSKPMCVDLAKCCNLFIHLLY